VVVSFRRLKIEVQILATSIMRISKIRRFTLYYDLTTERAP
jgi:hypothetical protein